MTVLSDGVTALLRGAPAPRRHIARASTTATLTAKAGQKVYRKWLAGTIGKYPKM